MEVGRSFYISVLCGLVALALLMTGMFLPAQLAFESRPYARAVLLTGNLTGRTASELGLTPEQLYMVKANYREFLQYNKNSGDDSESSESSDDDDDDDNEQPHPDDDADDDDDAVVDHTHRRKRDDDDDDNDNPGYDVVHDEDADQAEDNEEEEEDTSGTSDSDESESNEQAIAARLSAKPWSQTVSLGLFHCRVCTVRRGDRLAICRTVTTMEGIVLMNGEVSFLQNEINMPMWNNLRVESLFAIVACVIGLLCVFSTPKPCCDNKRLPVYLASVAFFGTGVLVFIPIVRLLLVRSDFQQNLLHDYNVTTQMMTSWSLLASGLAAPFALTASLALIATKWYKKTKQVYAKLKTKVTLEQPRDINMTPINGRRHNYDDVDYANINEQKDAADDKQSSN